jgi:hypothetical protein
MSISTSTSSTTKEMIFLSEAYFRERKKWAAILQEKWPSAKLIKCGLGSRTYRLEKRIIKICRSGTGDLKNEYEILKRVDSVAGDYQPAFECFDAEEIDVLSMNAFDGELLSDCFSNEQPVRISTIKIVWRLLRISIRGVYYRQFRLRHILVGSDNEFAFIDFGNSKRMPTAKALLYNFSPFSVLGSRGNGRNILSIIIRILISRSKAEDKSQMPREENDGESSVNNFDYEHRRKCFLGNFTQERFHRKSFRNAHYLDEAEEALRTAYQEDSALLIDFRKIELDIDGAASYFYNGANSINFLWQKILEDLDISGCRLLDWYSGQGIFSALATLEGAGKVLSMEPNKHLRQAGSLYSAAFGIPDGNFIAPDLSRIDAFKPDTVFFLTRRDRNPASLVASIPSCQTAVVDCSNNRDDVETQFVRMGFEILSRIRNWNEKSHVVIASRKLA